MHLKIFKLFSGLRRPETNVRHAHSHQQANALTTCINTFQSTIIIVYEVKYQLTANTNLEIGPIDFQK